MHLRIPGWRRRGLVRSGLRQARALLLASLLPLSVLEAAPVAAGTPWPATGPVEMDLLLPAGRPGTAEPLLTTGEVGRGDTLFVYYDSPGRLRFGWDSSVSGLVYSPLLAVPAGGPHRVLLSLGSLLPPGPHDTPEQPSPETLLRALLLVELDGRTVWRFFGEFQPNPGPPRVILGSNRIGSATLRPFFTGQIAAARSWTPAAGLSEFMQVARWLPGPGGQRARYPGAVRLRVQFPREPAAAADPVIVTGRTSKGDFLYVQVLDGQHLRFGFDHWGVGGIASSPVPVDLAKPHELMLAMDALYPPGGEGEPAPWRGQVAIWLDGHRVVSGPSACHPTSAEEIILGYNLIGGSTAGPIFRGTISGVESVAPADLGSPGS